MKNRKNNVKFFRLLVVASIMVWIFVIIVSLLILQIRGGLKPYAADDLELYISANGKVIDVNEVGIGGAKITLSGRGGSKYVYTDSGGGFLVSGAEPGEYDVAIEVGGFRNYESILNLRGSEYYTFTLHK